MKEKVAAENFPKPMNLIARYRLKMFRTSSCKFMRKNTNAMQQRSCSENCVNPRNNNTCSLEEQLH